MEKTSEVIRPWITAATAAWLLAASGCGGPAMGKGPDASAPVQTGAAEVNAVAKENFLRLYDAWQWHIRSPQLRFSSSTDAYIDCAPYRELSRLGKEALPYLIEKMGSGADEGQFFLWHAVRSISGVDLSPTNKTASEQEMADRYIQWWAQGQR